MVTGDQPTTAMAIARKINLIPPNLKTVDEIMEEENISWEQAFPKAKAIAVHGDQIN
jgi:sodium/potassium-transporting ATPase subunit alpha